MLYEVITYARRVLGLRPAPGPAQAATVARRTEAPIKRVVRPRILMIDDEPLVARAAERLIRQRGPDVSLDAIAVEAGVRNNFV